MTCQGISPVARLKFAALVLALTPFLIPHAAVAQNTVAGLSGLPLNAHGPISAALGKDDSGYWVHPTADGFRGENPRQSLSAEFTRQGAEVRIQNLRWALETRGFGYGDVLQPAKAVAPRASANRVEYPRDGMTEWYENGPFGLEQGFTLAHPPGKTNGQPLTLEFALRGDLAAAPYLSSPTSGALQPPALAAQSTALELRDKKGNSVLRYAGLTARDALGRDLRSWLEVRGQRLLVRIEDRGAQYPVVVDPWIQQGTLISSDGAADDGFGSSIAFSGSTIVVGAPNHAVGSNSSQGAVYVFVESGGSWTQQAELTASDGVENDGFGVSVALSGSTLVVGAPCHPWAPDTSSCGNGAAYVFVQSDGKWTQQSELTSSDGVASDQFGTSVAISGSTILVGASWHPGSDPNGGPGAAYAFVESGGTWAQQSELTASDGAENDRFGSSVALSGNTAVAGAPYHAVGSITPGAAYVFATSGGTWSQQAELTASNGTDSARFGLSVAVGASTAVVGAPDQTVGSNLNQGAAYVFVDSGGTWSQQAELSSSDGTQNDGFGSSVAVSGGTAVVGAPCQPNGGSCLGPGAAYVFVQSGDTWSQQVELNDAAPAPKAGFGGSVAVDGSTVALGAPGQTVGSNQYQGAAFVFGSSGPLYTLSPNPGSLSVAQGFQATSTITITPYNGFSGNVTFAASGLPSGVTAAFNPNPATSTSTLTLTASGTATLGSATLNLTGTSGSLTQLTSLTLTVAQPFTITPSSVNFGNVAVDTTSLAKTVTLKNNNASTLNISSITASANFAVSSTTCGATLAAGKSCKVKVTFTPPQLTRMTGTLTVTDSVIGSSQTVALMGKGVEQAGLAPSHWIYHEQQVGTTSPPHTFTLFNNLPVALTGISVGTSGSYAVSSTTCGTSLPAKGKCTIDVTFTPTQTKENQGDLFAFDSANNSPQTSRLQGVGY